LFITDIAKNHQVRKKYTIQLGENELVLKVGLFLFLFLGGGGLSDLGFYSCIGVGLVE
jgi:hypothetical protein